GRWRATPNHDAVVDSEVPDLLLGEPPVAVAAYIGDRVPGRDGPLMQGDAAPEREYLHEDLEEATDVAEGVLEGVPAGVRDAEGIVAQIVRGCAAPEGVGARRDDEPP